MEMNGGHSHNLMAVLGFLLSSLLASLILLIALVLWLGVVLNSTPLAMLIVGAGFSVIAIIIYLAHVRPLVREIKLQIKTIYEVAALAQQGYALARDWVVWLIKNIARTH
ncbi:MAG: hypothetical protein SNH88_06800 [Rikenellaceae bacterium]